jgi:hypothetical protein
MLVHLRGHQGFEPIAPDVLTRHLTWLSAEDAGTGRRPLRLGHHALKSQGYPFIILLADTRGQASINAASDQYGLRNNELNRDKSERWFRGDVLPSIDEHGRAVLIGNWLHTDGLVARLKNTGIFTVLEFPLLREGDGTDIERCTWKAKYPTQEALDLKRQELGDIGFRREMLLQVVPEEGQDVLSGDDDAPFDDGNYLAHGVDLAISTKENADYTAIVSGKSHGRRASLKSTSSPIRSFDACRSATP